MVHAVAERVAQCRTKILSHDVGGQGPALAALPVLPLLTKAIETMVSKWNPAVIKQLYFIYCSPREGDDTRDVLSLPKCSSDKCSFTAHQVYMAITRGPETTGDYDQAMHCLFHTLDKTRKDKVIPEVRQLQQSSCPAGLAKIDTDAQSSITKDTKLVVTNDVQKRPRHVEVGEENSNIHKKRRKSVILQCTSLLEQKLLIQELTFTTSASDIQDLRSHVTCVSGADTSPFRRISSDIEKNSPHFKMLPPVPVGRLLEFIHMVIRRFVPLTLFGSLRNRRHFLSNCRKVLLLGRKDECYLRDLMINIKTSHCK